MKIPPGTYTEEDIRHFLKAQIGFQRTCGMITKELGMSQSYLSVFMSGKRGIGEKLIKKLGLKTIYVKE